MGKPNGFIAYEGPSAIDGESVAVIVVGTRSRSANTKTGGMLQSYIILADTLPTDAIRTGLDVSVCGDCIHRSKASGGKGSCYVNVGQGVQSVYRAYKRGIYPRMNLLAASAFIASLDKAFRIGTYGDPGAVPDAGAFWGVLAAGAPARTGYTHRWQDTGASLRGLCMASVDDVAEAEDAWNQDWATFRVAPVGDTLRIYGEAQCPASEEAGRRVTCETCPIKCDGRFKPHNMGRVIQAHGSTKGAVT